MTRERVARWVAGLVALFWLGFLGWPRGGGSPGRGERGPPASAPLGAPNVVVVVGCTVRRDEVSVYGGDADTTPFLAERAAQGVVFTDALATSSWTRESAVGLLTGRHAASVGMVEPGPRHSRRRLPRAVDTVAEQFRRAGWFTVGITANPNLNRQFGFGQGFAQYGDAHEHGFSRRHKIAGTRIVRRALGALDRRSEASRPFYLQLVLIDAHAPLPGPPGDVGAYRHALRALDQSVAQLHAGLEARGHGDDDTVWVFVADHGEGLGSPAHHGSAHGKRMYPSTVRIPWLMWGPGVARGVRVEGVASGVDVPATLLGVVGLPPIGTGHAWTDQVAGTAPHTTRTTAYAASMFLSADVASSWTASQQCQSGYGRTVDPTDAIPRGCFDRRTDPEFVTPIPDTASLEALDRWRRERITEGQARGAVDAQVDPALEQQLEALGYRDEAAAPGRAR